MIKYHKDRTVLDAARERVSLIFDLFESVVVSVSGGKDSTVLCHLALSEAHRRARRVGVHFLDEEVLYQSSIEQIEYMMGMFPENTKKMWLQFPFLLTNATSTTEGQLLCWEPGKHKTWMRTKNADAVKAKPWDDSHERHANKKKGGLGFYDVIENYSRTFENTAFLVGLRAAGESPNRWLAVTKNPVDISGHQIYWGTRKGKNCNFYPIYDWIYSDIWKYIYQEKLNYSKIYDYQFRKGQHPGSMRVSSLIHEKSFKAICELPEFEPKTYNRLLKRLKGISMAQETGKRAKLFAVRKLPRNHGSWITYCDFLLKTHRDESRRNLFAERFARHLRNEYVARQQCRQLILNDYENNLPIDNKPDPRDALIQYYKEVL